jgi:hypothetical protein
VVDGSIKSTEGFSEWVTGKMGMTSGWQMLTLAGITTFFLLIMVSIV